MGGGDLDFKILYLYFTKVLIKDVFKVNGAYLIVLYKILLLDIQLFGIFQMYQIWKIKQGGYYI